MPASSRVWVLYTDSPKGCKSAVVDISTKFQTDVHLVLTRPGSRWLQILAPSSPKPSNHRHVTNGGWGRGMKEVDLQEFFKKPPRTGGISLMHRRSHSLSQHKSLPAFTTRIQFSKRWSSYTWGGKSFCCICQPASATIYSNVFHKQLVVENFTTLTS